MGEATARLLAAHGARVALPARREDRLAGTAAAIGAEGGQALPVGVDVTDPAAVAAAAHRVHAAYGAVDLVVNGAGVMLPLPYRPAVVNASITEAIASSVSMRSYEPGPSPYSARSRGA
ncbi:hypothetical protein CK485_13605 [Streptomyces sp. ICBB 8177]|nr:hypothetical protein CK485_13605 [Streptomyces sp. ICBB 8177]